MGGWPALTSNALEITDLEHAALVTTAQDKLQLHVRHLAGHIFTLCLQEPVVKYHTRSIHKGGDMCGSKTGAAASGQQLCSPFALAAAPSGPAALQQA